MIFKDYRFFIKRYKFQFSIGKTILQLGIRKIEIQNYYLPWVSSSVGENFLESLKKAYSENLEREYIGFINLYKNKKLYNFYNQKVYIKKSNTLSYGFSELYGEIDTTGTASGIGYSNTIFYKALYELIEKNELLLFWYGGYGKKIVFNNMEIEKLLNYLNDYIYICDEIKIFALNNLSNIPTVLVVLFYNSRIVGSGVSLSINFYESLKNAIDEAKSIALCFNNNYGYYTNYNDEEFNLIYNYINSLEYKLEIYNIVNEKDEFKIVDWIDDLNICFLNNNKFSKGKTIKIYSKKLFCSLPTKNNIYKSMDKYILKKYDIKIDDKLDCCIV